MKIRLNLFDIDSVTNVEKVLNSYDIKLKNIMPQLLNRIGEEGETYAKEYLFNNYQGSQDYRVGEVLSSIHYELDGDNRLVIRANSDEAVWIEFGAGVHYNGVDGGFPHPKGEELGMNAIGTYGKGLGKNDSWVYLNRNGEYVVTSGVKCTPFMLNTALYIREIIPRIVKELMQ